MIPTNMTMVVAMTMVTSVAIVATICITILSIRPIILLVLASTMIAILALAVRYVCSHNPPPCSSSGTDHVIVTNLTTFYYNFCHGY